MRSGTVLQISAVTVGLLVASALLGSTGASRAQQNFPLDRELLLDAQPIRPGKRMPSLTVTGNGGIAIDLWCKSVSGRVEIGEGTIAIVPEALPEGMPAIQSAGQCTPQRVQADETLLEALSQVTEWRRERDAVVLTGGPAPLRFHPATN